MKRDRDEFELAFVQYTEVVAPLDEVDEALECTCLQRAALSSGEMEMM